MAHCKACRVHLCPTRTSASVEDECRRQLRKRRFKSDSSKLTWLTDGEKIYQINSNNSSPRGCHQFLLVVVACYQDLPRLGQGISCKRPWPGNLNEVMNCRKCIFNHAMIWCELSATLSYRCSKWTDFLVQWISSFLLPRQRESCPYGNGALMLLESFC